MSPAPRTVDTDERERASHSWTTTDPRPTRRLQASHSWTYCEPRPVENLDADAARVAA